MKKTILTICSIISFSFTIFFGYFFVKFVLIPFVEYETNGTREVLETFFYGGLIITPFLLISSVCFILFLVFTIRAFKKTKKINIIWN